MPLRHAFAIAAILLSGSATASAAVAEQCTEEAGPRLHVAVQGVRSSEGNVTITLYGDDPDEFLASGAKLARHRVPAVAGETRDCMALPGPGTYAIAIYHDEDGDHDWDRNFIGLPTEGFGLSNNPTIRFSLPDFEDVRFEAGPGDTELAISMKY